MAVAKLLTVQQIFLLSAQRYGTVCLPSFNLVHAAAGLRSLKYDCHVQSMVLRLVFVDEEEGFFVGTLVGFRVGGFTVGVVPVL